MRFLFMKVNYCYTLIILMVIFLVKRFSVGSWHVSAEGGCQCWIYLTDVSLLPYISVFPPYLLLLRCYNTTLCFPPRWDLLFSLASGGRNSGNGGSKGAVMEIVPLASPHPPKMLLPITTLAQETSPLIFLHREQSSVGLGFCSAFFQLSCIDLTSFWMSVLFSMFQNTTGNFFKP